MNALLNADRRNPLRLRRILDIDAFTAYAVFLALLTLGVAGMIASI